LALADVHANDPAGWDQFADTPGRWKAFVGDNFRPANPPPKPRRQSVERRGDPLQISDRLSLLDANGGVIVAGKDHGGASVERPI
jgi:hypothetical protein